MAKHPRLFSEPPEIADPEQHDYIVFTELIEAAPAQGD